MKRSAQKKIDWPAVADALAERIPLTSLHAAALTRAAAETDAKCKTDHERPAMARGAIAFSGGADSLALLLLLWAHTAGSSRRGLVAMHFNHRLRGRAANADEKFCARVCAALGVKFVAGRWSDARRGASEAEARAARYAFFIREMNRRRLKLLWLAHHQDDIAETMLMRLARGSGTPGLAAPRPVQAIGAHVRLRPLLTLRKATLVAALRAAGAVWCEDATNASDDFFRTRVRRSVMPAWQRAAIGRDAIAGAALARERLEEDDAALEAWLDELAPLDAQRRSLDIEKLAGKPVAIWRRALHRWLIAAAPEATLSRQGFEHLLNAARGGKDTRLSLGPNDFAVVKKGTLERRKR